jgi:hypothetical protein
MQKDNATFILKRKLRLKTLAAIADPIILETHGGLGRLFASCYSTRKRGVVFEKDPRKADALATQRPTWSVYQCDCTPALKAGAGAHLPINFVDCDPYGSCWDVLHAFFGSNRTFPDRIAVVVNDGLRQKVQLGGAWNTGCLRGVVSKVGNAAIYKRYKELCKDLLLERVAPLGFGISHWGAYYTGHANAMTHFAAIIEKKATAPAPSASAPNRFAF